MDILETAAWLKATNNLLLLTHHSPDGDTLGSAAGLCLGLRSLGKTVYVADNPEATVKFRPLIEGLMPPADFQPETIVSLDTASATMLPQAFQGYLGRIALSIDHHATGKPYAQLELLDAAAAATGELVALLLRELDVRLTPELAQPLFVAIVTDTGCLRYPSTTSRTLRVAADLKDTGLLTAPIITGLFETKTMSRLALEAALLQDIEFLAEGAIALTRLTRQKLTDTKATPDDIDNISSLGKQIAGVSMSLLLREEPDGRTKISVRTDEDFDAGAICALLDGGGHARAAGATLETDIQTARTRLLAATRSLYPAL